MQFIAQLSSCLIGMSDRHGSVSRFSTSRAQLPAARSRSAVRGGSEATHHALCYRQINEQLDLQALHGIRERLVRQRTSIINQIRSFLIEYGLPVKEGCGFHVSGR